MNPRNQQLKTRALFVKQALDHGAGQYYSGDKLLYPITDYVLLAFQEPTCFSIWEKGAKPTLRFSSFRDPQIIDYRTLQNGRHLLDFEHAKFDFPKTHQGMANYFATLHEVTEEGFLPSPSYKVRVLDEIFSSGGVNQLMQNLSEPLSQALEQYRMPDIEGSDCKEADALSDADVNGYLSPMREILDGALEEISIHSSFAAKVGEQSFIPNLFAVVRTVRSSKKRMSVFPYTASLLLSDSQRRAIDEICSNSFSSTNQNAFQDSIYSDFNWIEALEAPLGLKARAIFDSVYHSGCVDFGLSGDTGEAGKWRDISGQSRADCLRRDVEKMVYGVLTENEPSRILYVPVHVGGVPWISLFTLTQINRPSSWHENYCFYRDIIAKLSDHIRRGAQHVYIERLASELTDEINKSSVDLFERVNMKWKRVAQVFPFRMHSLVPCTSHTENSLNLPKGMYAELVEQENPFCRSQVDYGNVAFANVRRRLADELERTSNIELLANEGMRDKLQSQAHTILNTLPGGLLWKIAEDLGAEESREFARNILCGTEVARVSIRIALGRALPSDFPNTPLSILKWLFARSRSDKIAPILDFQPGCPDFSLSQSNLPGAFTVLWNLWDNSEKVAATSSGKFRVFANKSESNEELVVGFENSGTMSPAWVQYLSGQAGTPNLDRHKCGLEIVMSNLPDLGWRLLPQVDTSKSTTRVLLHMAFQASASKLGGG